MKTYKEYGTIRCKNCKKIKKFADINVAPENNGCYC